MRGSGEKRGIGRLNTMPSRILLGLAIGLALGAVFGGQPGSGAMVGEILAPVGQLWLDALTMTVVPLVFGLLVTGIGSAASQSAAGGVAARAMLWFAGILVGACALGAAVTLGILSLWPAPDDGAALRAVALGQAPPMVAAADWFKAIIPANPIAAAADMSMTPLVVFALFFGFAATRIAEDLRAPLLKLFEALVATMLVIVHWVLLAGPLGVLALGYGVGAKAGLGALGALAHYVLVIIAACLAIMLAAYALVVATRRSPLGFARAALPVQVVALGTQSSLACLPAMIEATRTLRLRVGAAEVVLPLAVAIFRAASAAANIAVAIYLARANGLALSPAALASAIVVAAAVSLAAVGLPAQVSFFATIGPVCLALGAPLAALPVLLAVEALPDIFRTLGNVTTDLAVARIISGPDGRQIAAAGGRGA